MLKWINDFVANRKIRVRVEDQVSEFQETQSFFLLSPALFNVIMDTLRTAMKDLMTRKVLDILLMTKYGLQAYASASNSQLFKMQPCE